MYIYISVGIQNVLLKYGWMSMLSSIIQLDQVPKESNMESKHNIIVLMGFDSVICIN